MSKCLLSFGSNQGDRLANLKFALDYITSFVKIIDISSFYETEPVGYKHQGWFLNLVISCRFSNDPLDLLSLIKDLQADYNQLKKFQNAPRVIDVDILTFDDMVINTPELMIPHPRMSKRMFVLRPLKEIEPDFIHPVSRIHIDQLIETCTDESVVRISGHLFSKDDWKAGAIDNDR